MTVSEPSWELDEDDHEAQMMINLQAMRDYLATVIQREEPNPETEAKWPEEMSEEEIKGLPEFVGLQSFSIAV